MEKVEHVSLLFNTWDPFLFTNATWTKWYAIAFKCYPCVSVVNIVAYQQNYAG